MVAGHLSKKKGYYYAVLNYTDELGKRKTKWFRTGLPEKGNKKKAEAFLAEIRREFQPPKTMIPNELKRREQTHDCLLSRAQLQRLCVARFIYNPKFVQR